MTDINFLNIMGIPVRSWYISLTPETMGWTTGFNSRHGAMVVFFIIVTASGLVLGPTQPLIQWVPEALSPGVRRPGREADHSHPSSAEVRNAWKITSLPNTSSRRCV
jgi:hypothetical protein